MVEIKLHNTKTRKKEVFAPLDKENVRMYVCGPTVYDRAHLGNARPVIVFDVLFRLLRHVYGDDHVTYVRNFTDVDDKINATALARKEAGSPGTLEELVRDRSDETIRWYQEDMAEVGALEPTHAPRATDYISQMITMIEGLTDKGFAYEREGHVLFRVRKFEEYGALSGRSVDDMIAGARVEVAPYKEDPMDFVLWKPSDDELPGWESPWGRGRPGWHIECSAMAADLLGPAFDIHGGGNDLQFPHHENEIAQSKCSGHDFAQVWMHNEMLQVEGKKMSKSLGNFFTVRDLLDQGVPGEVIRFVMLSTHYRKPMDWTEKKREEAEKTLQDWAYAALNSNANEPDHEVVMTLANDLNTTGALQRLRALYASGDIGELVSSALLLGFDLEEIAQKDWVHLFEYQTEDGEFLKEGIDYQPTVGVSGRGRVSDELRDASLVLVHRWLAFRREQDWENADRLSTEARNLGVELRASRSANGVNNGNASLANSRIDPSKLEALK